jgi:RNA polymerase sigma-70 factor (ECF subfamily)
MPEQQRAALTLAYFDEMGNSEIATVLGTTVQAVESLLKRGRQGLRERLRRSERDIRHIFAEG